ncbi:aminotransferase class V-fold PLP-dependent enzyme [bacterium]|nr:aminotransferase class V-fold PLP-dependent enzyme [bacterium]
MNIFRKKRGKEMKKPLLIPNNPCFSSGPTAKPPRHGDRLKSLASASRVFGRSHRAGDCKKVFRDIVTLHRDILSIPDEFEIGLFTGSNSCAFETALWNLLGPRIVVVLVSGGFGEIWWHDVHKELRLSAQKSVYGSPGVYPIVEDVNREADIVVVWNETTTGVWMPEGVEWLPRGRSGLVLSDATSAVFCRDIPWRDMDIVTWSPQKAIGGEAAFGLLALSPCALDRIARYKPERPLPRIMRLRNQDGSFNENPFHERLLNTASMAASLDSLAALLWAKEVGREKLKEKMEQNYRALSEWVEQSDWIKFAVSDEAMRSHASVTLTITDREFLAKNAQQKNTLIKSLCGLLEGERMAYDVENHPSAEPGLRIWCGPTVETENIVRLGPCLDFAWNKI